MAKPCWATCIDWTEAGGLRRMGHVHWQPGKGGGVVAFEYDREWLRQWRGLPVDPVSAAFNSRRNPLKSALAAMAKRAPAAEEPACPWLRP
ncbi:MAG: hypothetical protein ACOYOB_12035 [Myxococcota bacterium]